MQMLIILTLLLTTTIILIEKNQGYAPNYRKASHTIIQGAPNNFNGTSNDNRSSMDCTLKAFYNCSN